MFFYSNWKNYILVPLIAGTAFFSLQPQEVEVGSYVLLKYQSNLTAQISKTETWKESFTTPDGKISIQIRSLLVADDKGRCHLLIWREDTRVYEEYLPEVT